MYSMKETLAGIEWRHDQQGIAQARLSITPTDLWPAVRALDCPTLFIRGARSDFLPLATLESIKQANKRSEEHTSELQSLMRISYAVFCLKKKKIHNNNNTIVLHITHTQD